MLVMDSDDAETQPPTLFIDGKWLHAAGGARRRISNPADGSVVGIVDEASRADAEAAVAAARAAFDTTSWPRAAVADRAALLERIADLLIRDRDQIARIETRDTGKTLRESLIDIDDVVAVFR